jgi:hypothetical protein
MTAVITRKFWFCGDQRWFAYFVNRQMVAMVRDELDVREITWS